jgi:hypothetical protein
MYHAKYMQNYILKSYENYYETRKSTNSEQTATSEV